MKKIASLSSAAPGELPLFISANHLAAIIGLTRNAVIWRSKHEKLPPLDVDVGRAKGWLIETLRAHQPSLVETLRAYFAAHKSAPL